MPVQTWAVFQTERYKKSALQVEGFRIQQYCEVAIPFGFFPFHFLFAWKYARSGAGWQFFKHWQTCRVFDIIHIFRSRYVIVVITPQCDYKPGKGRTLSTCFLYFLLSFLNHLSWLNLDQSTHRVLSGVANMHVKMGLPKILRHRRRKTVNILMLPASANLVGTGKCPLRDSADKKWEHEALFYFILRSFRTVMLSYKDTNLCTE